MENQKAKATKPKPVDVKAKFPVEEIREILPQSSNSVSHINMVILLLFFLLFALLRPWLHRSRKLTVRVHALIQNCTIFHFARNSHSASRPNRFALCLGFEAVDFAQPRVRVWGNLKSNRYFRGVN